MLDGLFSRCVRRFAGGTGELGQTLCCASLLALIASPSPGATFATGGGIGWPTAMERYLGASPSVELSGFVPLTEKTAVGLLVDYTHHRTEAPGVESHQQRLLAVVRWKLPGARLRDRIQPFAQFGVGAGTMEYTGLRLSELLNGPASRLGIGASVRINQRVSVETSLSYDRLEAASTQAERKYPTMVSLRCSLALEAFGSKPLLAPDR